MLACCGANTPHQNLACPTTTVLSSFVLREQKKHELKKLVMVSVKPEDVLADHVELNVKGIFMPRGDLYRMMSSIVGKTVYGSKTFQVPVIFVCFLRVFDKLSANKCGVIICQIHLGFFFLGGG